MPPAAALSVVYDEAIYIKTWGLHGKNVADALRGDEAFEACPEVQRQVAKALKAAEKKGKTEKSGEDSKPAAPPAQKKQRHWAPQQQQVFMHPAMAAAYGMPYGMPYHAPQAAYGAPSAAPGYGQAGQQGPICYKCNKPGHYAKNCDSKGNSLPHPR